MAVFLFVTGKLAADWLAQTLAQLRADLDPSFEYAIAALDIEVAAFMSARYVAKHLRLDSAAPMPDAIIVPGACSGDLTLIETATGVPVLRGTTDLKDLPLFIAGAIADIEGTALAQPLPAPIARPTLAARLHIRLSASPTPEDAHKIVVRARAVIAAGASAVLPVVARDYAGAVLTCLAEAGVALAEPHGTGYALSGAEIVEALLPLPPLGGEPGLMTVLAQAKERQGAVALDLDPLLDSIHADTTGAMLLVLSLAREAGVRHLVCAAGDEWDIDLRPNAAYPAGGNRRARVREVVAAVATLYPRPCEVPPALNVARDAAFVPPTAAEIALVRAHVTDSNFRIMTDGRLLYLFNDRLSWAETDPRRLLRHLIGLTPALTPSHALYLGREMYKADLARRLSKRYRQDCDLDWGIHNERLEN